MAVALQGSLWDGPDAAGLASLSAARRIHLTEGAWLDVLPGWLHGADDLFERLVDSVPWRAERRAMYDSVVDVPRLLSFYDEHARLPDDLLTEARDDLNAHYRPEHFATAGLCFYRDGRDSVAWHGDTIGRGGYEDTMVAIVSVGAPRALLLRPKQGGVTIRHALGHGDLLVMGGSCQRTWEHAVPKTARPVGPRISIQFRPRGVR
ncbi:MAG TPA: alpha-ketoglutarate-dependent dioxygenase AlkB [Actinokineospora sp.]|nr:alpha-ketoglutarate-dependent dioxygenase AlkB [Actinokineospora sp.]